MLSLPLSKTSLALVFRSIKPNNLGAGNAKRVKKKIVSVVLQCFIILPKLGSNEFRVFVTVTFWFTAINLLYATVNSRFKILEFFY